MNIEQVGMSGAAAAAHRGFGTKPVFAPLREGGLAPGPTASPLFRAD